MAQPSRGAGRRRAARGRRWTSRRRAPARATSSAGSATARRRGVAGLLLADVLVVAERGGGRGLDRRRHHQPAVLAHLAQVADELAVAGDEPGPQPGHVRALRQRVDDEHAVGCRRASAVTGAAGAPSAS